uniref:Uncharacterized protein n=1 Tax=Timema cristinae TaxID=61476 RepID=A0A7R9H6L9_TIMCR|nr:unnamed protein product [Timema cristinae]
MFTGVTMIGAMPAVAVRHERRKQEKRTKRPSQLYLGGYGLKQSSPPSRGSSPTPSPLQSPPSNLPDDNPNEFYVCGKVSVLHIVVVSLLMGAILLIVGLVQLTPGADASDHRYYLLAAGSFLILLGIVLTFMRCCFFPWFFKRRQRAQLHLRMRKDDSLPSGLVVGGELPASLHPSSDNEKNAQTELRNGGATENAEKQQPPASSEEEEEDVLVNSPANTTESSVGAAGGRITLERRSVSVSQSGDAFHSIVAASSEHDHLIKSNSSNLEKVCGKT